MKKHWGRPAFFSTKTTKDDLSKYKQERKMCNPRLVENDDPDDPGFTNSVEVPNEVSRQAIQDAVNGVDMQESHSMDEFMKAMED